MPNIDSINNKTPKVQVSSRPQPPKQVSLLGLKQKTPPKRIMRKIFISIILIIVLLGGALALRAANVSEKIFVGKKTTFFGKIVSLIRGGDNQILIGENLGQINILLLGIGGEGHDGPYLTDTIILAQIRPDLGKINLISIPRDYLATLPDNSQEKINAAFALGFGKNKNWKTAGEWSEQAVEKISGLKIPYFAVMDFSGFEQAVDKVGGLDVTIDNTFTDYQYPDSGTGFLPPLTFTKGQEHMNGQRALQFARSRHAAGNEGSDFARSARQEKIIEAFKAKLLSLNLVKDSAAINTLVNIFADHFHTNMSIGELLRINNIIKQNDIHNFTSLSLDPDTGLVCPEILASNGAYVLVPCNSQDDIKNFFKNSFAAGAIKQEQSVVWLANSTNSASALATAKRKLGNVGITVFDLGYTKDNLPQTIIYQANPKPATAEFLANELNGTLVNLPPPSVHVDSSKVDIIIVLGQSAPIEAPPTPYIRPPARIATSTDATASSTPATTTPVNKK